MIEKEKSDVRTITWVSAFRIVLIRSDRVNEKIYQKITRAASNLVQVGEEISRIWIPIVNKRISVTPIALIGGRPVKLRRILPSLQDTLDKRPRSGVTIGGYSPLWYPRMTPAEELIRSIPMVLPERKESAVP